MASGKSSEETGSSSSEQKEVTELVDDVDDIDDDKEVFGGFVPGPLLSLKEQIDKDKDDESLRRWKEKLLGCVESDLNGLFRGCYVPKSFLISNYINRHEDWNQRPNVYYKHEVSGQMEPEVKFHSIGIVSDNLKEVTTALPMDEKQSGRLLFTLKEGSRYQLKLTFSVLHNIVSGLTYSNTVWKGGLQVDQNKGMLGTFAPQREPYVHLLDEETTPSGVLARGIYAAKLKFEDDDKRCHMELHYSFEIKKGS